MVYELKQAEKAAPLFEGMQDSSIWSCLQGIMGKVYGDSLEKPASSAACLGDFCFLAGKPEEGLIEFILDRPGEGKRDFAILVPPDQAWAALIEKCLGEKAKRVTRYAIKKEPGIFDRKKLQAAVDGLPEGYVLAMIDEALFGQCRNIGWCRDWVSNYADYGQYRKYGLGAVILKDGQPVSGASSYSGYRGGIEVEIDTREDHRRKGLAYICGAKLILECMERGWYPSWDAQNPWSVNLARKLGYHFDCEYPAYEVRG